MDWNLGSQWSSVKKSNKIQSRISCIFTINLICQTPLHCCFFQNCSEPNLSIHNENDLYWPTLKNDIRGASGVALLAIMFIYVRWKIMSGVRACVRSLKLWVFQRRKLWGKIMGGASNIKSLWRQNIWFWLIRNLISCLTWW